MTQKTLKSSKNYPNLIFPFDETTETLVFSAQKRNHICQIGQIGIGRETLLNGVKNLTLSFGPKFFS